MFMKDFKRVISMILVVAMLAGFAGIPGMPSIVAQASKENGVPILWTTAATSKKPTDSFAAKNQLKNFHVPATLYKQNGSIVTSLKNENNQDRYFDTFVMFTVPSGTKADSIKVYQIDISDNNITNQLTWSDPTDSSRKGQYGHMGNAYVNGNTYKWTLSGSPTSAEVYYRIEYTINDEVPVIPGDKGDLEDFKHDVTYTQYAASYVENLPNYNAVWFIRMGNSAEAGDQKHSSAFYHNMSFLPTLALNGVKVSAERKLTGLDSAYITNIDGSHSDYVVENKTSGTNVNEAARVNLSFTNSIGIDWDDTSSNKPAYWPGGTGRGTITTSNTIGATVTYDSRAKTVSQGNDIALKSISDAVVGLDMTFRDMKNGTDSGHDHYKWAKRDAYCENWYSVSADSDFTYGQSYMGGSPWTPTTLKSVYSSTSYTYSNTDLPAAWGSGVTAEPTTDHYTYSLDKFFSSSITKLRAACHFTSCSKNNGNAMTYFSYGFHMDIKTVDRSSPHDYIDAVIDNNYVKAEMDDAWWKTYRESVLAAYVNVGNFAAAETTSFTCNLNQPKYKFADYSELVTALNDVPDYERGGATGTAGTLDAGEQYKKWNPTYNGQEVAGQRVVYNKTLNANHEIVNTEYTRTGAYYYVNDSDFAANDAEGNFDAGSWEQFEKVRSTAAQVYNYPESWNGFSFSDSYQTKSTVQDTTKLGLFVYAQTYINSLASELTNAKNALVLKGSANDHSGQFTINYGPLIAAVNHLAWDNVAVLDENSKHGLNNVPSGDYTRDKLYFRTNTEEDLSVGEYWFYNETGGGINSDVGAGHTFHQKNFNNTDKTNFAVTRARDALKSRLIFNTGTGVNRTVEGAYSVNNLTEEELLNGGYTSYLHTEIQHQDDILRAAASIYAAADNLRLVAHYYNVRIALCLQDKRPEYDANTLSTSAYQKLGLRDVTTFYGLTPAEQWDQEPFYSSNVAYYTTGLTWYENTTWQGFVADRNVLANMIYNNATEKQKTDYNPVHGVGGAYITEDTLTSAMDNDVLAYEVQNEINAAVAEYYKWFNKDASDGKELVLKEITQYAWMEKLDDGTVTSTTLFDKIEEKLETIAEPLAGRNYYYIVDSETKKLVLKDESLYEDAFVEINAYKDQILAILATPTEKLAVEHAELTRLLNDYVDAVEAAKTNSVNTRTQGWTQIFNHLTELADGYLPEGHEDVNSGNLPTIFAQFFNDDANKTIEKELTIIIETYNGLPKEGKASEQQKAVNDQIYALYDLLTRTKLSSKGIESAISAIEKEMAETFIVYNPYDFSRYAGKTDLAEGDIDYKNPLYSWGDDSATVEANKHNGLSAISVYGDMSDQSYSDMVGYLNTAKTNNEAGYTLWNTSASELDKIANTLRVQAGLEVTGTNYEAGTTKVLEESKVKLDVLLGALKAANRSYEYVQNVTAVNPEENGENYAYNKFTSESVEEIRGVVRYVEKYLVDNNIATITTAADGTKTYTAVASRDKQLEVDKLVFFVLDEIENKVTMNTVTGETEERSLLSVEPTEMVDGVSKVIYHFTWTYTYDQNGVCTYAEPTLDETKFTGNYSWENLLHKKIEKDGGDNGLALAPAYYGFLDQQINTPYNEALTIDKSLLRLTADGKVDYTNAENIAKLSGIVWIRDTKGTEATADDTLELVSNGGQQTGADIFEGESWSAYTTALSNAQTKVNRALLSNSQGTIDEYVEDLYTARVNLQLRNFTANPAHKFAVQFADAFRKIVNATVSVNYYTLEKVTAEDGTVTITPASNSVNVDPYTYTVDKAALVAEIDLFVAMYVENTDKTAGYNDVQPMYDAANAIQNKLDQCTLKTLDNEEFKVGYNSLVGSAESAGFIAGTYTPGDFNGAVYTGGEYDSDIIAKSQIRTTWDNTAGYDKQIVDYYDENSESKNKWTADSQGDLINDKLDALYQNFNGATFTDDKDDEGNVTKSALEKLKEAVTSLNSAAVDLYYYTTGQDKYAGVYAKDLQFAVDMQGNELYKFLEMKVGVGNESSADLSFYYGAPTEELDIGGIINKYSLTYDVFKQRNVQVQVRDNIEIFFADESDENWPRIYQVDRLSSTVSDSSAVASVDGFIYSDGAYVYNTEEIAETAVLDTDTANKIIAIHNLVGSHSSYYSTVLGQAGYLNNYMTEHTVWMDSNTLYIVNSTGAANNGYVYVLADAKVAEGDKPVAYDMVKTEDGGYWYTPGKGIEIDGKQYYQFSQLDTAAVTGSSFGSWFEDEGYNAVNTAKEALFVTRFTPKLASADNGVLVLGDSVQKAISKKYYSYYYINKIITEGWSPKYNETLYTRLNAEQEEIDINVAKYHNEALHNLKLLPATDAYRDVMELWQKSHNTEIDWGDYNGINPYYAKDQEGCPITLTEGVEATLYNASDNFINRLADLDPRLKGEGENENYKPEKFALNDEYWYVAKTNVVMDDYYKTDDENGYYAAYEAFCNSIANTPDAEKITIDRADEVNGPYNKNVPQEQRSLLAQAIDLMAKLELTSLKYGELEDVVKAFFYNYNGSGLCANDPTFKSKYNLQAKDSNGNNINFYDYTNYINEKAPDTNEPVEGSLAYVVTIMHNNGVISDALYNNAVNTNYQFILPFGDEDHKGTLYTNAKNQDEIDNARQAIVAAINKLKLKDAELDALDAAVNRGLAQNPDDYDVVSETGKAAWDALQAAIKAAQDAYYVPGEAGETLVLKIGLDIRSQNDINAKTEAINDAIANLKFKADTAAPKMRIGTTPNSMGEYYAVKAIADADQSVELEGKPATGTYIMPVKAGYSIVIYTNQLNPRFSIDLQDEAITGNPLTTKPEKLSVSAKKTVGASAQLITGTSIGEQYYNITNTENVGTEFVQTKTYITGNSETDKTAKLFAILAPNFDADGDQKQAVLYQIAASDSAKDQPGLAQGTVEPEDNYVAQLDLEDGKEPLDLPTVSVKLPTGEADKTVEAPAITVYIYYMNTMTIGADGEVNDEGIVYDENNVLTGTVGSYVTNNIEGQKGTWQNIFGLQRSFPNIKAWELIDENKDGYVNWIYPNHIIGESTTDDDSLTKGPIYYDPTFGQMNTGSFAYVLDKNNAFDKTIIDKYNSVKTANGTDAADMDYEAATAAKNLLINGSEENEYKDKLTREHFEEIKEYASFARFGSYQYWSQGLNGKYGNGDLVFVHVVDRWGNVCNRIMQVSDYDGIAPEVNSNSAGTATIVEQGGSGLETVGIWQNGEQTASVQTNSAAITLNATDDVTVEEGTDLVFAQGITVKENSDVNVYENADGVMVAQVSGNKFTVDGLVPGKEYQVGACDTAGNVTAPSVLADANGNVEITVVEDEEATFSLNSDIVVTINTGISSSVTDAEVEGNVIANKYIDHIIVTKDNVTQIKVVNLADNKETVYKPASTIMYDYEDGTIGWETYYKLTEGQHSYKVYAMVDGAYEEMGVTYTFDATLKTVPLSLSVVGNGKIVLEYSGAAPANVSNFKLVNIPYGAKVTIKATSLDSNSKFYYWQNDVTNRVLNVNEEMSFTAVAAVDYDAYFTNSLCMTSEYKYVVYVNNAGNVIKSVELRDGNNDYIVPLGPSLPDHEFKGWAMSKAEVIASEEDIVVVRPIYTLNAEYTVELTEGNYTVSGAGTYTAVGNQRPLVTINASAMNDAGEDFLYWIDEETKDIVSYDRAYAFNCIKNVVLTPVYGDGSSLVIEPVIRIADVRYDASSGKVSFYSQRSIGDDYILYETGIIVTRTQSIAANEDSFVLGGVSTAKGTSTSTAPYGTYSVNVSVSAQETVWARAYAVVETADGEIIEVYGDIVPYTNK